ncbi:Ku protein [Streptomyces sp. WMMC500]|uniref:non-homologous end joining protein Ku n=1 Tax=Streptomyces sp. WMMC500 TaxID=3015154 RepID=UPI00248B7A0D|nr:Ku protein [Streptomyces sp. WMMC500]WBB59724.1 Ku protein [Streptomyces sp. WMMC500]
MKSIWKGAISFGLVSIPVQLYSATEEHGVSFKQVHAEDGGRIRYRRFCELEDREVQYAEITRAYETADGELVVLSPEDLAQLPLPSKKIIDVVGFEDAGYFDPIQFSRAYYVKPVDAAAAKPYVLLREALKRSGRVAVVKVALRNREAPALVRVLTEEDVLVLHTMLWPDEVRSAQSVAPDEKVTVRRQELDMVDSLMDALGGYDPDEFTDEYREAVEALVASKEGIAPLPKEAVGEEKGQVIDLMSALEASVQAARDKRGATAPRKKAAAKKTAGKKAAGEKTAAKKTAGKKSAGKKTASKKTAKKTTKKPGKAA